MIGIEYLQWEDCITHDGNTIQIALTDRIVLTIVSNDCYLYLGLLALTSYTIPSGYVRSTILTLILNTYAITSYHYKNFN